MSVSLTTLEQKVRVQTDRVNDPTITRAQILAYLSDAGRALVDLFNESAPHWLQSSQDFTLTLNTEAGSYVDLPDDFELDLGLDWLNAPGSNGPVTVRRLPTFQDRNLANYSNPILMAPYVSRQYEPQGDRLRVYGYQNNTAGSYRLWYTKRFTELADPITLSIANSVADSVQDQGGFISFLFDNGAFTDEMVGGILSVDWDTPNDLWNGDYEISEVLSPTLVVTTIPWPAALFTPPAVGTASVTYQPADTQPELPNIWTQFQLYLVTYACISVKMQFEEGTTELERRLAMVENQCKRMAQKRDSGIRQVPVLNGRRSWDSVNYDPGDWSME